MLFALRIHFGLSRLPFGRTLASFLFPSDLPHPFKTSKSDYYSPSSPFYTSHPTPPPITFITHQELRRREGGEKRELGGEQKLARAETVWEERSVDGEGRSVYGEVGR